MTEGIEGDILMIADLEGDWREELITALPGELRIYHTNIPARDRRVTLMEAYPESAQADAYRVLAEKML